MRQKSNSVTAAPGVVSAPPSTAPPPQSSSSSLLVDPFPSTATSSSTADASPAFEPFASWGDTPSLTQPSSAVPASGGGGGGATVPPGAHYGSLPHGMMPLPPMMSGPPQAGYYPLGPFYTSSSAVPPTGSGVAYPHPGAGGGMPMMALPGVVGPGGGMRATLPVGLPPGGPYGMPGQGVAGPMGVPPPGVMRPTGTWPHTHMPQ